MAGTSSLWKFWVGNILPSINPSSKSFKAVTLGDLEKSSQLMVIYPFANAPELT
jgi:hypothetical protein